MNPSSITATVVAPVLPDVPVLTGLQAQGDLLIIPASSPSITRDCRIDWAAMTPLTPAGHDVVKGENGRHSHTLHAATGTVSMAPVTDTVGLAIVAVDIPDGSVALLTHVEHGDNLIGPGRYVIRAQQEKSLQAMRRVVD